jgi:nitroimidazol reductase NimA-like FMN-containing flavoprotein (pyridoxamine 5'-phosphate oxidase superfamily)
VGVRRSDREVTERAGIESIIRRSTVCRLGLSDGEQPYVVPLCFGFKDDVLYFHGASVGKKIEILSANPRVCFEFDLDAEIVPGTEACAWGMKYRSVIGFGRAALVNDLGSKREALDAIMRQYGDGVFSYSEAVIRKIAVIAVTIDGMTCKQSGYG